MKPITSLAFLALGLASLITSPLSAGDSVADTLAPASDTNADKQKWFGPPHIQFARQNSDSQLPGYAVGTVNYMHQFTADFDDMPGDVSSDSFNLWVPIAGFNNDNYHLFAWFNYGATKYNTSEPSLLTEHTLESIYMPVVFIHDISEQWIWGAMVMPSYSGAQSNSDNFAISAAAGVGYSYNDSLELFAGAYYYNGFGEEYIIPGLAFIWRPAPRWEAYLLPPVGGISYNVNERLFVSLIGQYSSPTWHVTDDRDGPDRDINISSLRIGLKAEFNVYKKIWAFASAGVVLGQELDIENSKDHSIEESDIDTAGYVRAGFNYRF